MGVGGMAVALVAGLAALVVLPALLALLGRRVKVAEQPAGEGPWYRLSQTVMRRPGRIAAACALLLIVAGLPALGIEFTVADARVLPADAEARQTRETLESRFPPNPAVPVYVAIDSRKQEQVAAYAERIERLPGVADLKGPHPIPDRLSLIQVVSEDEPLTEASQDLVRAIRDVPAPFSATVGGRTAEFVDQKARIAAYLPTALGLLAATTFALLFLMTGSVVVPLKALLMNFLALSASFGLLVLIFQDGRLEGVLDYESLGALEASMPVVMFAVAFGLSTDYGIFLLERIREARAQGADDEEAVAIGLERCGRIVTAAGLLLCVAIGALATSQIVFVKQLAIGTGLAVIIDATIIRALLVPAVMRILGPWNWWPRG
jgi:RND superfamily putative drug exporter